MILLPILHLITIQLLLPVTSIPGLREFLGPGIDEVHGAAVPSSRGRVCPCQIVIETMGATVQPSAIFASVWNCANVILLEARV